MVGGDGVGVTGVGRSSVVTVGEVTAVGEVAFAVVFVVFAVGVFVDLVDEVFVDVVLSSEPLGQG